ncbi:hypothetical protein HWV62_30338 [Athelia sp. TMB]|nr:hypothetical protein HWV62_30338 [Athelia sp. TMB]
MSAQSIARWNNIPLANPNESNNNVSTLKRSHPEQAQDDEDDDMSLISRSPSPDAMDVDPENIAKYDEYYVRRVAPEVITVDTRIKPTNKGFAMLAKLGWLEGQPLGTTGDGRVDPIPFQIKRDLTGLGKTTQDVKMIETTVSQRRGLDSERQVKETEDQRRAREEIVARRQALESEISSTLAAFYCALCSKQFKNVAQYDEHTNSYAHHHKARMKDMQTNAKGLAGPSDADERKEKERKREEKELRRAAKAAGVKMAKPAAIAPVPTLGSVEAEPKAAGFKKSGWATVSAVATPPVPAAAPASQGGWASASASGVPPSAPGGNGWTAPAPPATEPPPPTPAPFSAAPAFRNAGWTSLDTGSSQPTPQMTNTPPPPSMPSQRGGWSAAVLPPAPSSFQAAPPEPEPPRSGWQQQPPPPPQRGWAAVPSAHAPPPPPPSSFQPAPSEPAAPVRSGWQQFNSKSSKRR